MKEKHSFLRKSGSIGADENPTFYRKPIDYCQMLNYVKNSTQSETEWFKLEQSKSLSSYIRVNNDEM